MSYDRRKKGCPDQSDTTVLDKAKYAAKGLDYARIDALRKAKAASKGVGSKLRETGEDVKESLEGKDVIDVITEVGPNVVIGVGTFAIKRVERLLKSIKKYH